MFFTGVIFEPDADDNTCVTGAKQCHINAQCIDHSTGYCCKCIPPAYGNGLNCLQQGQYSYYILCGGWGVLGGSKQCHINAQCIDHNTGYCCKCIPPSYGNGLNCLQQGQYSYFILWGGGRWRWVGGGGGGKQCYINAQCIGHSTGYCCKCIPPSYENGLNYSQQGQYSYYILCVCVCGGGGGGQAVPHQCSVYRPQYRILL